MMVIRRCRVTWKEGRASLQLIEAFRHNLTDLWMRTESHLSRSVGKRLDPRRNLADGQPVAQTQALNGPSTFSVGLDLTFPAMSPGGDHNAARARASYSRREGSSYALWLLSAYTV